MEILCYGASNTWGYDPHDGSRFGPEDRWPAVLQGCLGSSVEVVEEGLSGRSIRSYEPAGSPYNGLEHLERYLRGRRPFALIILFLGTNDLFADPTVTATGLAGDVVDACERIGLLAPATRILLIPPLPLAESTGTSGALGPRRRRSREFAQEFLGAARRSGRLCFDASAIVRSSPIDGIHLEATDHRRLGEALCRYIRQENLLDRGAGVG
ncbi:MAG: hypothetical protein JW820_14800 [Spirochaetales bacterium]|nr:hypothetical protein [Spirochaetales bacterium]